MKNAISIISNIFLNKMQKYYYSEYILNAEYIHYFKIFHINQGHISLCYHIDCQI